MTSSSPNNIGDIIAREQAIGALSQLKIFLSWFDGQEERLKEIVKKLKQTHA